MRVGLVIPCYIDVFYPEVGIATLEVLEKLGIEVEYPFDQTCCGQPEDYSDWSDAADIDVTIVRSPLAVAETGSVLLTENELRVNTIGFLAHDIVILLDPKDIIRHKA